MVKQPSTVRLFIDAASAAEDEKRLMIIINVEWTSGISVTQISAITIYGSSLTFQRAVLWPRLQSCPCTHQKVVWVSEYIAPLFLNAGSSWRWAVSFSPQTFCPRWNRKHNHLVIFKAGKTTMPSAFISTPFYYLKTNRLHINWHVVRLRSLPLLITERVLPVNMHFWKERNVWHQ